MSFDADGLARELARRGHGRQAAQLSEMVDDQDRIYERMNAARAKANLQSRADEIKGELINKIMEEKAAEDGLKAKVAALEESDPQLWAYIRKLEYINKQIWCPKCEVVKFVPGFNEPATEPTHNQCPTCAAGEHREQSKSEVELETLRKDYAELEKSFNLLAEYMTGLNDEFQDKIAKTLEVALELQNEINSMRERAQGLGLNVGKEPEKTVATSEATRRFSEGNRSTIGRGKKKEADPRLVGQLLNDIEDSRPDFSINGEDIDSLIEKYMEAGVDGSTLTSDSLFGSLDEE